MAKPRVSIVVAMGRGRLHNHVIGKNNELLWHIPDDLKRFKALTVGHPVIMGRKTFESILASLGKPLPGRTNIVITRDQNWQHDGAIVTHSVVEALEKARAIDQSEIFIGGGSQLYEQVLPQVDRLYLTLIDDEKDGDTYFPDYENEFTKVLGDESREWNGIHYRWLDVER
jgi:dihydrofolate reductase